MCESVYSSPRVHALYVLFCAMLFYAVLLCAGPCCRRPMLDVRDTLVRKRASAAAFAPPLYAPSAAAADAADAADTKRRMTEPDGSGGAATAVHQVYAGVASEGGTAGGRPLTAPQQTDATGGGRSRAAVPPQGARTGPAIGVGGGGGGTNSDAAVRRGVPTAVFGRAPRWSPTVSPTRGTRPVRRLCVG